MKINFKSEAGQSVVLIALMMVGLVAMVGLALDGGEVYLARRDAQNASDAGAFAGARVLTTHPDTDTPIRDAINTYAQQNNVASPSDVIKYFIDASGNELTAHQIGDWGSVPADATGVVVTATVSFQPFLISVVVGGGPIDIPARAKIQTGHLTSPTSDLMPMTIPLPIDCSDLSSPCFTYNQEVQLFGDPQAAGNFQWVNYECGSATPNDVAAYLYGTHVPPPPPIAIGDWICGDTGVGTGSQITTALNWWLLKPEQERRWIIPVYDITNGMTGSNIKYRVFQFAAFVLTGYHFGNGAQQHNPASFLSCVNDPTNPNAKCISGKFLEYAIPGQVTPGECNVSGIDICGLSLVE